MAKVDSRTIVDKRMCKICGGEFLGFQAAKLCSKTCRLVRKRKSYADAVRAGTVRIFPVKPMRPEPVIAPPEKERQPIRDKSILLLLDGIKELRTVSAMLDMEGSPCVYFLINENDIVYVGKTCSLGNRISNHRRGGKQFSQIYYLMFDSAESAYRVECALIRTLKPALNNDMMLKASKRDFDIVGALMV